MFLCLSVVYSFSFSRSIPVYASATANCLLLLLVGIQGASNVGTISNDAAVSIVVHIISVGHMPRSATAWPQGTCVGFPLVGPAK